MPTAPRRADFLNLRRVPVNCHSGVLGLHPVDSSDAKRHGWLDRIDFLERRTVWSTIFVFGYARTVCRAPGSLRWLGIAKVWSDLSAEAVFPLAAAGARRFRPRGDEAPLAGRPVARMAF